MMPSERWELPKLYIHWWAAKHSVSSSTEGRHHAEIARRIAEIGGEIPTAENIFRIMSESPPPNPRLPRARMALYDAGHTLPLPGGFWLRKDDDNQWQIGGPFGGNAYVYWAMNVSGNVGVGPGGSCDMQVRDLAAGLWSGVAGAAR